MKKLFSVCTALCLLLVAAGCGKSSNTGTAAVAAGAAHSSISVEKMNLELTDRDSDDSYSADSAVTLSKTDEVLNITAAGTYLVSGTHRQIVVAAPENAKVQLVLQNVTLTAQNEPAIYVKSADKVFVTLAEQSVNTVSDGGSRQSGQESADAAIFSKADLTVNGTGTLKVTGNYKHGIVSKDDLVIANAKLAVTAARHGLEGKDCLKLSEADLTVTAGGDALRSTNEEDETRGFIVVYSGNYSLTAEQDAVQAQTALLIKNGTFTLQSGGGSANASTTPNGEKNQNWGNWGRPEQENSTADENTASAKGLKAGTLLKIENGSFTVDSSDDSIHANGDIEINGGSLQLTSGDDGVHADSSLFVNGGTLTVQKSYEGLEAGVLNLNGGNLSITAFDDGLNAAGGKDGSALNGRPGQNEFAADESVTLNITGGYLFVNALGDGLDSNGNLTVTGGTILVSGPEDNGNGALDYNGEAVITGGTVIATGSGGMAQGFGQNSTQAAFMYTLTQTVQGGTEVAVTQKDGTVLASFLPSKAFNNVVVSCQGLSSSGTYQLKLGGTVSGADENGFAESGTVSGEQSSLEVALTGQITTFGSAGGLGQNGGPGKGGQGEPGQKGKGGPGGNRQ